MENYESASKDFQIANEIENSQVCIENLQRIKTRV